VCGGANNRGYEFATPFLRAGSAASTKLHVVGKPNLYEAEENKAK